MPFDAEFIRDCLWKILASSVCGILLGIERKSHTQVVGLRTLVLISVSSTLLSILSIYMAGIGTYPGDPTRIAAGVASGIGFLGGGTILRQGMNIKGLTSAAIIWAASALGMALGAGMYVQVAAVLVLLLCLLLVLEKLESRWFPAERIKTIHFSFAGGDVDVERLRQFMQGQGIVISDLNLEHSVADGRTTLHFLVRIARETDMLSLSRQVSAMPSLVSFSVTE